MATFGARLREAMEASGYQLGKHDGGANKLARDTGISSGQISKLLSDAKTKEPEASQVRTIARQLGVRYEWLQWGEEPREPSPPAEDMIPIAVLDGRADLPKEASDRVVEEMKRLAEIYGASVARGSLAQRLGRTTVAPELNGSRPVTVALARAVAKLGEKPLWQLLGKPVSTDAAQLHPVPYPHLADLRRTRWFQGQPPEVQRAIDEQAHKHGDLEFPEWVIEVVSARRRLGGAKHEKRTGSG